MEKSKSDLKGQLSIIVPVYNADKYLRKCLKSITNQTYKNLQIILVDDGSTDSSYSVCKEIEKEDPRVVVASNKGKGVSSARNCGIKMAKGDYITFVDSDDYLELDAYEKAFERIEDFDAVFYGYFEEYENLTHTKSISPLFSGTTNLYDAIYYCLMPDGNNYFTSVCNKIFKRDKVKELLFDESFAIGEDEVWLIQAILKLSNIVFYNKPLYHYIQRSDSTIHSFKQTICNWPSHVATKEKAIQLVSKNKKCCDCISAKEFSDLFNFVVYTYVFDGYCESQKVYNRIKDLLNKFLSSKGFSYKRKIKILLVCFLIQLRTPKSWVGKIWETTTFKIKLFMKKI